MKKFGTIALALTIASLAFILVDGCKKETAAAPVASGTIKSAEKNSFNEVTSKLDPGGNLYLYLSTEQWLTNLSDKIDLWRGMMTTLPNLQDHQEQVSNAFDAVNRLVKDSGVEDISGFGMSSIAREPGLYYNKIIFHHYAGDGNGFIWSMFGKEPHELDGLDLLPANTAMAVFHDVDAAQVWSVIQKECEQSGFPQATEALDKFQQQFDKNAGIKWKDVIGSLDGEFGFVITLDENKMVTIPLPKQGTMEMAEPAMMLVVKVKNDAIFNRIDEQLQKQRNRLISVDKGGLKMRTVPVPLPLPITLRPSIATSGGYLFLATSDALIQEALAVKDGKAGLKSTDEFKKLSVGVPERGNQFGFLSRSFGQELMEIQQQMLDLNSQTPPQVKEMMQSFMQPDKAAYTYTVGANTDEGWISVGNGNQSGEKILAAAAIVPGALAAIAVPNFIKARETARKNTCINNLRLIDAAKQQWALEKNKTATDVPTWDDLKPYLGHGGKRLECPDGGHYTIGAVGETPECSIADHMLPRH